MNGYYIVVTEYESGRVEYSVKRYQTQQGAERRASINRLKLGVKSSRVCYQTGMTVDIKKFI